MTFLLVVLIGWGVLSPFIIGNGLKQRIEKLEAQVAALRAAAASAMTPAAAATPAAASVPQAGAPKPFVYDPPPGTPPPLPQMAPIPASGKSGPNWAAVEHWIVERWIIAAGGLTAALGGLFIVRYSIEQGLLGPGARVILGGLVGLALVAAAEWVRRRSDNPDAKPAATTQVPAALAAAGLITLYGVTYAAHAFYSLIPAPIAFILLAIIAFASLGAGLIYGPLAAGLGAAMSLIAPALVASDNPNAAILFPYLFFVTAGIFAVIRYRDWPWLTWLALGGNAIWQLSWMLTVGGGQDIVRVLHLLAIPAVSAWLLLRDPWPEPAGPWWRWGLVEGAIAGMDGRRNGSGRFRTALDARGGHRLRRGRHQRLGCWHRAADAADAVGADAAAIACDRRRADRWPGSGLGTFPPCRGTRCCRGYSMARCSRRPWPLILHRSRCTRPCSGWAALPCCGDPPKKAFGPASRRPCRWPCWRCYMPACRASPNRCPGPASGSVSRYWR